MVCFRLMFQCFRRTSVSLVERCSEASLKAPHSIPLNAIVSVDKIIVFSIFCFPFDVLRKIVNHPSFFFFIYLLTPVSSSLSSARQSVSNSVLHSLSHCLILLVVIIIINNTKYTILISSA